MITLFIEMNKPDFAAAIAFAKVAEVGSFRVAATALSSPASTVSVQVRRLEERLGTTLLERTTRRVSLTEEGRVYFEQIRNALDVMEEAERSVSGRASKAGGKIRLGAPVDFGQAAVGKVLAQFVVEHPNVQVETELTNERLDPVRDGFDLVIQTDPPNSASLVAKKLGVPTRQRTVASPAYLEREGTPRHPRELSKHTCIVMGTRQSPATWRFSRAGSGDTIVHRQATANAWALVRDLAVAGCGVARLPEYLALPEIGQGSLVAVLEAFPAPPEQMFAVYAKSRHVPMSVQAFVKALKEFLDVWPGCLLRPSSTKRHAP
ncbi:Transcriptional regulator, LysR family [Labilithrix luteola]|uniref:Transcriptional regulator, LysR family n=1 Tax=Labilithrix luteola TaxID=1391654 RepID=A0A0K1PKJ0_9BACT|nr:LysR family transcriptional regulator [Labilithrix luteola]AKU93911.1 Transcriptional regulator, LysR family [Labilithrix luteola]